MKFGLAFLVVAGALLLYSFQKSPPPPGNGHEAPFHEPAELDEEALRALGYVDTAQDTPRNAKDGVTLDTGGAWGSYTYVTDASACSSRVIDMKGKTIAKWSHDPCKEWGNSILQADGSVIATHKYPAENKTETAKIKATTMIRLDAANQVVWKTTGIVPHHDVDIRPDGKIAVLTRRVGVVPRVHETLITRDHQIAIVDAATGVVEEEVSIAEILLDSSDTFNLNTRSVERWVAKHEDPDKKTGPGGINLIHANTVEWMHQPHLAKKSSIFDENHVLICMRAQDAVAIIDWRTKRVVWSWGQETLSGPHDATVLPNGNLLIFDNGLDRSYSRVLEVDILTKAIVWSHDGGQDRYFSVSRGGNQRLPNGNTLITVSDSAFAMEVTPDGEIVWRYLNPLRGEDGQPVVMVRMKRFSKEQATESGFPTVRLD
jgi:hypothetical protein